MVSIRTKLSLLIYAGVFLTAAAMGSIGIIHVTNITKQNSRNALSLVCTAEKEHLDITMGHIKQTVDSMKDIILSSLTDVNQFVSDVDYRDTLTQQFESIFYTIAYHTQDAITYYVRYNPELSKDGNQGFLWAKRNRFASFSKTELTDITMYDKDDVDRVGWYYIPVENGKATWLKPYANQNLGIYMISYVVPVYVNKNLIGVVGMDIDFSIVVEEINRLNVYESGDSYISDEENRIVYHKEYETGQTNHVKSTDELEISMALANDWKVTVTASKSEINKGRNFLVAIFCALTVGISALFIFLGTRITRKITKPLLELTEATKKIASGDLNVHITTMTNDEIGILAETFKKTVQHLPEYMYRDSLTGVRNAAAYKRTVATLEDRMANENMHFAICVFDVNNLKQTNDLYGHETGNLLLLNATRFICRVFAHSPVFRIGGDEFVAVLETSDFLNREQLLEQFAKENGTITFSNAGTQFSVSVAYGLSEYDRAFDQSYADVFNRADAAMYKIKKELKSNS